jgi:hypothetical protein
MPANQTDEDLKALYRAIADGKITDADAEAAETALYARRGGRQGNDASERQRRPTRVPRAAGRRPKVFGCTYGRVLDRNQRARLMHRARALMRRTEPGRAYGELTAKQVQVFEAMLFRFLNSRDGRLFPSLARLAEAVGCAVSTVQLAIAALERTGLLGWVHRLKRVVIDGRTRVHRTSNGYSINPSDTEMPQRPSESRIFPSLASTAATEMRGHSRGCAQESGQDERLSGETARFALQD